MTNAEINRKISELREPIPTWKHIPTLRNGRDLLSDGRCWWMEQHHLMPDGTAEFSGSPHPLNWTGSEDASAVLLEEMPRAYLVHLSASNEWECAADSWDDSASYAFDPDRKIAIAMAWLAWKENK